MVFFAPNRVENGSTEVKNGTKMAKTWSIRTKNRIKKGAKLGIPPLDGPPTFTENNPK